MAASSNEQVKLNPGHAHEALDRCHIILYILDDHLLNHPYVQSDSEVLKEVDAASKHLGKAYQLIGAFDLLAKVKI